MGKSVKCCQISKDGAAVQGTKLRQLRWVKLRRYIILLVKEKKKRKEAHSRDSLNSVSQSKCTNTILSWKNGEGVFLKNETRSKEAQNFLLTQKSADQTVYAVEEDVAHKGEAVERVLLQLPYSSRKGWVKFIYSARTWVCGGSLTIVTSLKPLILLSHGDPVGNSPEKRER